MEFGSEHVYLNESSDEEEYIPVEELEQGIVMRSDPHAALEPPLLAPTGRFQPNPEPQLESILESRSDSAEGGKQPFESKSGSQVIYAELGHSQSLSDEEDQPRPKPPHLAMASLSQESSIGGEQGQLPPATVLTTPTPLPLPPKPPHGILKKHHAAAKLHKGQKVEWMSYLDRGGHKNILRKYQPSLVEHISLPDLLPHLNHHSVVTEEENKLLLDLSLSSKERVLKLISFVSDKSGFVYTAFMQALEDEQDHPGHRQLVGILKAAGEKDIREGGDGERGGVERQRGVVSRQVDTNVIAITFNTLVNAANVHAGDVVMCTNQNCTAVVSHLSKISEDLAGRKTWRCEFCGTCNFVELEPQEMPTKEETTYLLTPPPVCDQAAASGSGGVGNTNLIFCIDVSGSMGVTVEVEGKRELRTDEKLRRLSVSMKADIGSQYMPQQKRNVTYISRLQSVQNAIEEQMNKLVNTCPSQRVGIVAFSDEVTLLGDSVGKEVVVAGDRLSSVEELLRIGAELTPPPPITQCRVELSKKVSELEEGGQTALGPALLLSVLLAGSIPGSKVIVCTDGLANKGVGNLDVPGNSEDFITAQQFYTDLGNIALEKGVTVSLVTIKGVECRVLELGGVADATGGDVTIVDPLKLSLEFSNIVANPIIATNVECQLVLHNRLCFQAEGFNGNVMHASVGNVTSDAEFSFEYKARRSHPGAGDQKGAASDGSRSFDTPVMVGGVPHLPFQLQTEYTSTDGAKLMRVVTKLKPITQERETAEKGIDFGVVGSHSVRTSAALASEGRILEARAKAISCGRVLTRSKDSCNPQERVKYSAVMSRITPLERQLRETQLRASTTSSPSSRQGSSSSGLEHHGSQPTPQQGLLAQAMGRSPHYKSPSKPSGSVQFQPRKSSSINSPSVMLTDDTEASELRRSSTDAVAAELYQCKKMSSKSIEK